MENKSGFRILWTQEGDQIVVWFVAKHKSVSRLAKLIDDAKSRTSRQQIPESMLAELNNSTQPHRMKREILLDALGNVPLKLYDVSFDNVNDIVNQSWTPQMHLTSEERKVVEAKGTVLLLGRSGTGKTVCICNRIEYDRQRMGDRSDFSQLFVSRSSQLCRYVKDAVGGAEGMSFTTFDKLVGQLFVSLSDVVNTKYQPRYHVSFRRFNSEFYATRYPQEDISALIVWKAIRTFLKGSIEAYQTSNGLLSREHFVSNKLGKTRCKVPLEQRGTLYDIFSQYQLWIEEEGLWDDCDRINTLLKGIEEARRSQSFIYEDKISRSKVYVDEVRHRAFHTSDACASFLLKIVHSSQKHRCRITSRWKFFYSFILAAAQALFFWPAILHSLLLRALTFGLRRFEVLDTLWPETKSTSFPTSPRLSTSTFVVMPAS